MSFKTQRSLTLVAVFPEIISFNSCMARVAFQYRNFFKKIAVKVNFFNRVRMLFHNLSLTYLIERWVLEDNKQLI